MERKLARIAANLARLRSFDLFPKYVAAVEAFRESTASG
jgi:hypothetical protein